MHPNKFLLKRIYGLEEVVWKILRRLFIAWPSFVSKWNERSIYESLFGLKHPIKFLLMRTYGFEEDVVGQISRLLFSSQQSWYLIYSEPPCCLVSAWEDIWFWRTAWRIPRWLFNAWPSLISKWNDFIILSLHVAWCLPLGFCREYMGWNKLFEKFQEGCLVHNILWYLSEVKAFLSLCLA